MTINYTTLLGLAKPVTGTETGQWGDVVNDEITSLLEDAVANAATFSVTSGNVTLTTTNGASNQARMSTLIITGTPGTTRNVIAPSQAKIYQVINQSDSSVVIKGSATTGVTIPAGATGTVVWNGSDFVEVNSTSSGRIIKGNLQITGNLQVDGNTQLGNSTSDTLAVTALVNSNLLFTDATYDIGASGATRPRDLFLSRNITVGGNTTLGDATSDTLTVNALVNSNLLFTDGTYDIGASGANRPRNLYLSGGAVLGGTLAVNGSTTLGDAAGDTLTINGTAVSTPNGLNFDSNTLVIDATNNRVGINDSVPHCTLAVDGVVGSQFYSNYGGNGVDDPFGRKFNWTMANSSSSGATWRKIAVITLPDAAFSSASLQIVTINPGSNYGAYNLQETRWINQANITRRDGGAVINTGFAYGAANSTRLRLHQNSIGEWELQANAGGDNAAVMYEVTLLTSGGGAYVTSIEGQVAGTTGGTVVQFDGTRAFAENTSSLITYGGVTVNEGGGDNDFRVESVGNTNMLLVDASTNRVGIGLASPSYALDVTGTANTTQGFLIGGDKYIYQGNQYSGSLAAADIVVAPAATGKFVVWASGTGQVLNANATGELVINESSNDYDFRVESDTNTHMLFVDAGNSRVGIATSAPQALFQVGDGVGSSGNSSYPGYIQINDSGSGGLNGSGGLEFKTAAVGSGYGWKITSYDSFSTGVHFSIGNRANNTLWTQQFTLNQSGFCQIPFVYTYTTGSAANVFVDSAGTLYRSTSSLKYKKNVQDYTRGLADLLKLRPVFYEGTGPNDDGRQYAGLISEEVEAAGMTEFVDYGADGKPEGLYYQHMVALLVKSITELKSEFDAYKASHP